LNLKKSNYLPSAPPQKKLKQNRGVQKRKCNPRPGELAADLTGAVLDAGKTDCRIIKSRAARAIKMQSKNRLPATWLAGDCKNIHISPSLGIMFIDVFYQSFSLP